MRDASTHREVYLPATAVLSSVPGRLERFLRRRFRDHGVLAAGRAPEGASGRPAAGGR